VRRATVALAMIACVAAVSVQAQRFRIGELVRPNPEYDGQFTFVRLRYGEPVPYVNQRVFWAHDYPVGERHFMQMLDEVSYFRPKIEATSILGLADPEIYRYPVVYMAEPGYWIITEDEAEGFRTYLKKGGFVIFDDFSEGRGGWTNFEYAFRRVLPEARFYDLDSSHPIFHSFFEIDSLDIVPTYDAWQPSLRAVFEDNDPSRRMMAVINYNTDISEFWEYSTTGLYPIVDTNEAYKLGVNYVIYAMTH
jgi:hypothetical protein